MHMSRLLLCCFWSLALLELHMHDTQHGLDHVILALIGPPSTLPGRVSIPPPPQQCRRAIFRRHAVFRKSLPLLGLLRLFAGPAVSTSLPSLPRKASGELTSNSPWDLEAAQTRTYLPSFYLDLLLTHSLAAARPSMRIECEQRRYDDGYARLKKIISASNQKSSMVFPLD